MKQYINYMTRNGKTFQYGDEHTDEHECDLEIADRIGLYDYAYTLVIEADGEEREEDRSANAIELMRSPRGNDYSFSYEDYVSEHRSDYYGNLMSRR